MPTSRGLDVSSYQGTQDWKALARSGITFAFAKASEGMHSHDSRFATHIAGIVAAGLVPGAYHYGWPTQDPEAEAANYISAVHDHRVGGFVHVLDLEKGNANYGKRTAAQIKTWATAWITAVQAAFPHDRVGVYTSASDIAAGHMPGNASFLWYPAYPSGAMSYADAEKRTPPAPGGRHPLFWQFTSTPGDRNIAYLSPADLRRWALGTTPQPDPEKEPTVAAEVEVSAASALRIAQQVAGFVNLKADVDATGKRTDLRQRIANAGTWAKEAADGVKALDGKVGAISLTADQLADLAGLIAAHPALATAIAEQVAVKLAARLQS